MTRSLIAIVLVLLLVYGGTRAWPLISGPALRIDSPSDFGSYPDGIVEVRGRADRANVLTLNGAPLVHDQNGGFSSTLTFPKGGSILTFVATDRFGKQVNATRTIYVP